MLGVIPNQSSKRDKETSRWSEFMATLEMLSSKRLVIAERR